ncbi:ead/Ea22-like family protein [Buttiauxella gaviniae]|uniref:ead/Ea22-like family protein n=1 Tax=Buttiauxella gaviniae TaxID=82990 RepID=UPI003C7342F5
MTNTAYEATNSDVRLIAAMKSAAKKATPGQWQVFIDKASSTYSVFAKKIDDVISWMGFDGRKNAGNNAIFIAIANPENILKLIAALEQAQQENKSQLAALTNTVELWNEQRTRIAELEKTLRGTEESLIAAVDQVTELESHPLCVKSNDAMREAAPLCVKLPDSSSKAFWSGVGKTEKFHPETYKRWVKEAIERAGDIAGIQVEVK